MEEKPETSPMQKKTIKIILTIILGSIVLVFGFFRIYNKVNSLLSSGYSFPKIDSEDLPKLDNEIITEMEELKKELEKLEKAIIEEELEDINNKTIIEENE